MNNYCENFDFMTGNVSAIKYNKYYSTTAPQSIGHEKKHLSLPLFNNPAAATAEQVKSYNSNYKNTCNLNLKNLVFLKKKGSQISNPNVVSYNFPGNEFNSFFNSNTSSTNFGGGINKINLQHQVQQVKPIYDLNKYMSNNLYNLLFHFFKSMYCLISKPVIINTPDKIIIQLFYFLCLPKILFNKSISFSSRSYNLKSSRMPTQFVSQSENQTGGGVAAGKLKKRSYIQISNFNSKDINVKQILTNLAQPDCNLIKVYPRKFKLICRILSKFLKKKVEFELIRLHQPYYDSNILVNLLALIMNKKNIGASIHRLLKGNIIKSEKGFTSFSLSKNKVNKSSAAAAATDLQQLFMLKPGKASLQDKNNFNRHALSKYNLSFSEAYLSGLNIKISGRLMREPIIPRRTTKKFEKGFTANGKVNYLDVARFTHKNRKGAFTITVKSGQKFF